MKPTITFKSTLANLLDSSGIISWKLNQKSHYHFVILMYHRVIPRENVDSTTQAGMYVEPETFDLHIKFLKKHFVVVPLAALVSPRGIDSLCVREKYACALTFDDGWHDFYQYAFPILKSHQVPATVFLPTEFIGTDRWFWTDRLRFMLLHPGSGSRGPEKSCDPFLSHLLLDLERPHEAKLEKYISLLKQMRNEQIERILMAISGDRGDKAEPAKRVFLDWKEVIELAGSGLVSFGSHTAGHRILTTLTNEEASRELRQSRDILLSRNVVDPSFIPFSYPNGNYTNRLTELVRKVGYHLAVTTANGWNQRGENPFAMKRISIHEDMTSTEALFGARIVNFL